MSRLPTTDEIEIAELFATAKELLISIFAERLQPAFGHSSFSNQEKKKKKKISTSNTVSSSILCLSGHSSMTDQSISYEILLRVNMFNLVVNTTCAGTYLDILSFFYSLPSQSFLLYFYSLGQKLFYLGIFQFSYAYFWHLDYILWSCHFRSVKIFS